MQKKYCVKLKKDEKINLIVLTSKGKESARKIKRANILLLADEGKTDKEMAEILKTSISTIDLTSLLPSLVFVCPSN